MNKKILQINTTELRVGDLLKPTKFASLFLIVKQIEFDYKYWLLINSINKKLYSVSEEFILRNMRKIK